MAQPSQASQAYLQKHEAKDLEREVEALRLQVGVQTAEITKLRQLTDKGTLQVCVRNCQAI
jgi:hypothetical protein